MKNFFILNVATFFLIIFTACTPNYYYLKPEISGKIYDNKTKKPIAEKSGYIGFNLNENKVVSTDEDGEFKITPEVHKYYIIRPNWKKISLSAPYLYIYIEGYKPKTYDYSNQNLDDVKKTAELEKLNIGNIYLDPE